MNLSNHYKRKITDATCFIFTKADFTAVIL